MDAKNNKPSFWARCGARIKNAVPYITAFATVAAPFIDCLTHSAKNDSNVKAQRDLTDIRYNDWVRRQEYRRQHPNRSYRRRRHGKQ